MTGVPTALPAPRPRDPASVPALRWGVLGTGWIAQRFTAALQRSTRQVVHAVGSRGEASARRFAAAAGVPVAHGSYEALVADPAVDVVYVATPHHTHREHALLAVAAGKHVLVEKPLGLTAAQAREVSDAAAARGVFCAEAMWTLFLPRFDVVRQVLADGLLGDVRTVLADHGERFAPGGGHRILDPALAGGTLLDLGSYLTTLATWALGPAEVVHASGEDAPSGVNGQASALLAHAGGRQSVLHTTLFSTTPCTAVLAGTRGSLVLPTRWFTPGDVELRGSDGALLDRWRDPEPHDHGGLHHQATEVAARVGEGATTTPLRPADDVVAGLAALDAVADRVGARYPELAGG
ncbi:Gfo/Idh/MocA family protein [Kineococcus sp. SYSU DK004]|uniref:Gfo/Idh/MocA family protein n=1 Tax=Kineococcus sp. SYSU DK004 TaxID=3383125 RepID=UPI003D7D404D